MYLLMRWSKSFNVGSPLLHLSKFSGMLLTLSRVALWLYPPMSIPSVQLILTRKSVGRNAMISRSKLLLEKTMTYIIMHRYWWCIIVKLMFRIIMLIILADCILCDSRRQAINRPIDVAGFLAIQTIMYMVVIGTLSFSPSTSFLCLPIIICIWSDKK